MKDLDSIKLKSEEGDELKSDKDSKSSDINLSNNDTVLDELMNLFQFRAQIVKYSIICLVLIINIYGLNSYLYSLKGCKNSRAYCLSYYSMAKIKEMVEDILKSSICYSLIFILAFWKLLPLSYFIVITSVYLSLFIYDHNDNFENHGYYNLN